MYCCVNESQCFRDGSISFCKLKLYNIQQHISNINALIKKFLIQIYLCTFITNIIQTNITNYSDAHLRILYSLLFVSVIVSNHHYVINRHMSHIRVIYLHLALNIYSYDKRNTVSWHYLLFIVRHWLFAVPGIRE